MMRRRETQTPDTGTGPRGKNSKRNGNEPVFPSPKKEQMKAVAKHSVLLAALLAASFAGAQQSVRIGTLTAANPSPRTFFLVGTGLQTSSPSGYVISSTDALAQEFVLDVTAKSTSLTFV